MSDVKLFFAENLYYIVIADFIILIIVILSGYFIIKKYLKEQETLMTNILICVMFDVRNSKRNNIQHIYLRK